MVSMNRQSGSIAAPTEPGWLAIVPSVLFWMLCMLVASGIYWKSAWAFAGATIVAVGLALSRRPTTIPPFGGEFNIRGLRQSGRYGLVALVLVLLAGGLAVLLLALFLELRGQ